MKFIAPTNPLLISVALLVLPVMALADNQSCAYPPGPRGTIKCESDQVAICDATGSRIDGQCLDKKGKTGRELAAHVLTAVLGRPVLTSEIQSEEYRDILREGKIVYESGPGKPISRIERVISFSSDGSGGGGSTQSLEPREPVEKHVTFKCVACLKVEGQETCETGTGPAKSDAQQAAAEKLAQRLKTRLGYQEYSKLGSPSLTCE